ncbi:hypothetical protein [Cohnella sp. GbtcB17]|uniref:hypothetical protein n=1 Tax=Cohnella sp. GbtcB17 TaxID=2824762 RepID=UPI001C2FD1C6|nr:hypothetical protein [Cohnella sp. GbtcB17]
MTKLTGDQARNAEDQDNNSLEQEQKIGRGQDIEPQAEEWEAKQSQQEQDKPNR